jgi:AcrR family transcriptional regulator
LLFIPKLCFGGNKLSDLKQIQEDAARKAILDTAVRMIIEQGLGSVTMRRLAKQVGCSPATLYKHFDNKDSMMEAIRQEGWRLMGELDSDYNFAGLSPIEHLKLSGKIFQEFPQKFPEYYMLMFGSMDAAPMSAASIQEDEGFQGLIGLLAGAMLSGDITTEAYTPKELAFHIWMLSHGIAMLRMTILRDDPAFEQLAEDVLASFAQHLTE